MPAHLTTRSLVTVLELAEPLRISRGSMDRRDAVWIAVSSGDADPGDARSTGYGETVTSRFLRLDAPTARRMVATLGEALADRNDPAAALDDVDALAALLDRRHDGEHPAARAGVLAGVEAALLDLAGKRAGRPAHELLGLTVPRQGAPSGGRPSAATARTIGIVAPERAAAQATELAARGFALLKIKAGAPDPADDLARIAAVRAAAPAARLLVDANGAWSPARGRELLPRLADLGVDAVEQPLPAGTPEELARLAASSPLPLIADEDVVTVDDALRLAGLVHGVNVKLAKCGGVLAALRIAEGLRGTGTELMLGCLVASSLGLAPAVQLGHLGRWADLDGHLLLADDPWEGIGGEDGTVRAPARPGLGVRPRAAASAVLAAPDAAGAAPVPGVAPVPGTASATGPRGAVR
ncbi:mandelate racemase/muconate lactonizing enzyme family protein [Allostreptomyces psammosilenae]|uniref:L-alanine-DL-glutamate epimerase-like enolase superfamily enzyme n=1 Tax=Allostreptomyces psammosilenae TaxID=1892865 RepID=A0A852ZZZ7_9ACTN|nr:enolase C-terminal domain-like protein [Allostreptomyces psammosilenae]NYI07906.1 L-alanine-DL-glutamate epimerase-like enolase superfamily enzyme [Allostreptomyces psammosilenae]